MAMSHMCGRGRELLVAATIKMSNCRIIIMYLLFLLSVPSWDCYQFSPVTATTKRASQKQQQEQYRCSSAFCVSSRRVAITTKLHSDKSNISISKNNIVTSAEKNMGMILKKMKELGTTNQKQPLLGIEMKRIILALLQSASNNNSSNKEQVWKMAWNMIRQYTTQLSKLSNLTSLIIPIEVYNTLLMSMSTATLSKETIQILDEMLLHSNVHPLPDLTTYTLVLEAACCSSKAEEAVQILLSMKNAKHHVTLHIYEIVIAACLKKNSWRRAIQLLYLYYEDQRKQIKVIRTPNTNTETAATSIAPSSSSSTIATLHNNVILSCVKAGEISKALQLFTDLRQRASRSRNSTTTIPIATYNSLMSACASSDRHWNDALQLFDDLSTSCNNSSSSYYDKTSAVEPDIYTYTIAIRACARGKKVSRALSLLQSAKDKGLPLDVYVYTSAMDACAKAGYWQQALDLLDEIILEQTQNNSTIAPNAFTYTVAIAACSNGGQWGRALELLQNMKANKINTNTITYNAVISALAKGSTNEMKRLVKQQMTNVYSQKNDGMEHGTNNNNTNTSQLQEQPNGVASSSIGFSQPLFQESTLLVSGPFEKDQLWRKALDLLDQMKTEGVKADAISYSSAIVACGSAGRWKEALELVKIMQQGGPTTRPNKIAYTNAITACGRSGEYEHALELFSDMKKDGLKPDRVSYNALISALKVAHQPEFVFQIWNEMIVASFTTTTSFSSKIIISPDIVTVTDVIAALERSSSWRDKSDLVFAEAVKRKILLKEDSLDSMWEVDLSGMSFPVAHTAVRYVIRRLVEYYNSSGKEFQDMTFITGVGVSNQNQRDSEMANAGLVPKSLREFVRVTLSNEFQLFTTIPKFSAGSVVIKKEMLLRWMKLLQ